MFPAMRTHHFDRLAKSLSAVGTRRALFQLLPVAGGLGALRRTGTAAKKKGNNKKCKNCGPCKTCKQGKCKGKKPDGTACAAGTCQSGSCIATPLSPPPQTPPPPLDACASCSGDEVCSGGACIVPACGAGGPCHVFLSSIRFNGALGGLSGADAKCQKLADSAGLAGTYKAWLSDNSSSPISRFVPSSGPYRLVNGTTVATSFADLTDGALLAPIDVTETGGRVDDTFQTWTRTKSDGSGDKSDNHDCVNWTANTNANFGGCIGNVARSDAGWTDSFGGFPCNARLHLYCFQQR
jgi:hypothetical protein